MTESNKLKAFTWDDEYMFAVGEIRSVIKKVIPYLCEYWSIYHTHSLRGIVVQDVVDSSMGVGIDIGTYSGNCIRYPRSFRDIIAIRVPSTTNKHIFLDSRMFTTPNILNPFCSEVLLYVYDETRNMMTRCSICLLDDNHVELMEHNDGSVAL